MPEQWYWDTFYWIFAIFTEILKNGSLIYRNGSAASRLYKRYFSATGGRITCMYFNCWVKFALKVWQKNVYIVNVKISVYLTKKLPKYCLKVEYTRNPVRQSMRCYGLFSPSLRSRHYCEVTAVPRIHFSKTPGNARKTSLMPLWNISNVPYKPNFGGKKPSAEGKRECWIIICEHLLSLFVVLLILLKCWNFQMAMTLITTFYTRKQLASTCHKDNS